MSVLPPEAGDLIWLTFDPQAGREQAGRRPAFVLSPRIYNQRAGLAVVCPITSQAKGYPFEVAVPPGLGVAGVIPADPTESVHLRARQAEKIGAAPEALEEILGRLGPLLGMG
jgi:mRNA interferase MazF